jgi:hypothetical protein
VVIYYGGHIQYVAAIVVTANKGKLLHHSLSQSYTTASVVTYFWPDAMQWPDATAE